MNDAFMDIVTDIYSFLPRPSVATIGSFDGVHLGHCAMLAELGNIAKSRGLPLMVVTFVRHPRLLFDGNSEPFLLSEKEEKASLLAAAGVDILVELDFDTHMAAMDARRFMKEILLDRLGVKVLAIGYDHHFGRPCAGEGFNDYVSYGRDLGVEVLRLSPFAVGGITVSSSAVRRALLSGDVAVATSLLGRYYTVSGKVVHCAGIGRKLGFPTANISLADEMLLLPANGVYEVVVSIGDRCYKGVMNVGVKPTVNDCRVRTAEVHIIDFSSDIYGSTISVAFIRKLRDELLFENLEALRKQIGNDVEQVKKSAL